MRRIATEEAFASPMQMEAMAGLGRSVWASLDLPLWRSFTAPGAEGRSVLRKRLLDLEDERLSDMDANGVDVQVLSLTSPGVQMFDPATAASIAIASNDYLAEVIARHSPRFVGLAAFAPQDPARAVKEMERAIGRLKLNGFIVNSHTNGEYLDSKKFWPILEAAEALERPLYIHPRCPPDSMIEAASDYGLAAGMWGFHVETSLHATRMILGGVFDRFPKLQIVLGHMGEGLPYWLYRIDHVYKAITPGNAPMRLKTTPEDCFKRNFVVTTSGVNDPKVLSYVISALGIDAVMWAIDYPYEQTAPAVAFADAAPLSEADRAKLYHSNAERVFHIAPVQC